MYDVSCELRGKPNLKIHTSIMYDVYVKREGRIQLRCNVVYCCCPHMSITKRIFQALIAYQTIMKEMRKNWVFGR